MKIQAWQTKQIHTLKSKIGLDDEAYRLLLSGYGVTSSKELTAPRANQLLDDLSAKAVAAGVWERRPGRRGYKGKPKNMEGQRSRAQQLQKIEALLTIGKKPWAYADSLAQRICKVDKIAWVPDNELYKIITALRKQAQREGWDLEE